MIARIWHGWTAPEDADAYEQLLKTRVLPGIHRVKGYGGAWLLRRPSGGETEFITITLWESMEAIRESPARKAPTPWSRPKPRSC